MRLSEAAKIRLTTKYSKSTWTGFLKLPLRSGKAELKRLRLGGSKTMVSSTNSDSGFWHKRFKNTSTFWQNQELSQKTWIQLSVLNRHSCKFVSEGYGPNFMRIVFICRKPSVTGSEFLTASTLSEKELNPNVEISVKSKKDLRPVSNLKQWGERPRVCEQSDRTEWKVYIGVAQTIQGVGEKDMG